MGPSGTVSLDFYFVQHVLYHFDLAPKLFDILCEMNFANYTVINKSEQLKGEVLDVQKVCLKIISNTSEICIQKMPYEHSLGKGISL